MAQVMVIDPVLLDGHRVEPGEELALSNAQAKSLAAIGAVQIIVLDPEPEPAESKRKTSRNT